MRQQLNLADEKQAAIAQKLDTVGSAIEKTSDLLSVIKEASTLSEESWMALGHGIILRGLRRNSLVMNSRFEMIRDPAASTFAWILDKPDALLVIQYGHLVGHVTRHLPPLYYWLSATLSFLSRISNSITLLPNGQKTLCCVPHGIKLQELHWAFSPATRGCVEQYGCSRCY